MGEEEKLKKTLHSLSFSHSFIPVFLNIHRGLLQVCEETQVPPSLRPA